MRRDGVRVFSGRAGHWRAGIFPVEAASTIRRGSPGVGLSGPFTAVVALNGGVIIRMRHVSDGNCLHLGSGSGKRFIVGRNIGECLGICVGFTGGAGESLTRTFNVAPVIPSGFRLPLHVIIGLGRSHPVMAGKECGGLPVIGRDNGRCGGRGV